MKQINMCVFLLEVGMPVVNSSLSSHHFSPCKVVKVVFRNLVRARTELIEAQAVCLVMLDYRPEIDFRVSAHSLLFVALVLLNLPPKVPVALAAHNQARWGCFTLFRLRLGILCLCLGSFSAIK